MSQNLESTRQNMTKSENAYNREETCALWNTLSEDDDVYIDDSQSVDLLNTAIINPESVINSISSISSVSEKSESQDLLETTKICPDSHTKDDQIECDELMTNKVSECLAPLVLPKVASECEINNNETIHKKEKEVPKFDANAADMDIKTLVEKYEMSTNFRSSQNDQTSERDVSSTTNEFTFSLPFMLIESVLAGSHLQSKNNNFLS